MLNKGCNRQAFAERLKESRGKLRLTQKELAERVGLTNVSISDYENRKKLPNLDTLVDIAHELRVSVDWLLGYDCDYPNMEALWKVLDRYRPEISFEEENNLQYGKLTFKGMYMGFSQVEVARFLRSYQQLMEFKESKIFPDKAISELEESIKEAYQHLPDFPPYDINNN